MRAMNFKFGEILEYGSNQTNLIELGSFEVIDYSKIDVLNKFFLQLNVFGIQLSRIEYFLTRGFRVLINPITSAVSD